MRGFISGTVLDNYPVTRVPVIETPGICVNPSDPAAIYVPLGDDFSELAAFIVTDQRCDVPKGELWLQSPDGDGTSKIRINKDGVFLDGPVFVARTAGYQPIAATGDVDTDGDALV